MMHKDILKTASAIIDMFFSRLDGIIGSQHRAELRLHEERVEVLKEIRDELRKQGLSNMGRERHLR